MKTITNARDYEKELTRIYDRFNKKFWNNELPNVIITFTGTKGALGHVTPEPVWESKSSEEKYDLNISAYSLNSPDQVSEIILHEQCHLYNIIKGIKDTSSQGRYHNRRFKETAESHGLLVYKTSDYGWCETELSSEAKAYVKKLNVKQFEYIRERTQGKNNNIKYGCPNCKDIFVYVSSHKNVLCGNCMHPLIPMEGNARKKSSTVS